MPKVLPKMAATICGLAKRYAATSPVTARPPAIQR